MAIVAERPDHVDPACVRDIDVYAPPGGEIDIHDAWKTLQREGEPDIIWTPRNGGHWIVTRAAPMTEVYQDYRRFSSRLGTVPKTVGASDFIPASLDPPQHRSFRSLLNGSFAPKKIEHSRARVREVAVQLIDRFKDRGYCEVQEDYANHLPVMVFMEMMELPVEDATEIKFWSDQITRQEGKLTPAEAEQAFYTYLDPVIRERRGTDRNDIVTRLVSSAVDGREMTHEEALSLTAQVLQGGVETVINFLGFVLKHLAQSPDHRRMLIADPSLIRPATDEFFRRFGIVINTREVAQDTELAGVALKQGDAIVMPNMLAGMDDRMNANPMEVDFDRSSKHHLTFGAGSHRCPGAPLARIEVEVTIEEWLKRIPDFALAPDAAPRYRSGVTPCVTAIPLVWDVPGKAN